MDAAFIKECADASLKPAIVERFVDQAGARDPFAITVRSGGRLVLVPKPRSADEAMAIVRQNAGSSIVRVGLTQLPAGIGVTDVEDLKPSLVEPCSNLRAGTLLFSKVLRIVARWYGNPTSETVFPQIFDDAIDAWKTGMFDGKNVFMEREPGGQVKPVLHLPAHDAVTADTDDRVQPDGTQDRVTGGMDQEQVDRAGIRIDLSRIDGR